MNNGGKMRYYPAYTAQGLLPTEGPVLSISVQELIKEEKAKESLFKMYKNHPLLLPSEI